MPLPDELVNHFRAEASRLANTLAADEIIGDLRHLEALVAKRAQIAQSAFVQGEQEARDWLTGRMHPALGHAADNAIEAHENELGT